MSPLEADVRARQQETRLLIIFLALGFLCLSLAWAFDFWESVSITTAPPWSVSNLSDECLERPDPEGMECLRILEEAIAIINVVARMK